MQLFDPNIWFSSISICFTIPLFLGNRETISDSWSYPCFKENKTLPIRKLIQNKEKIFGKV